MKKKAKQKSTRGRKPVSEKEKKQPVTVYISGSLIETFGGIEKARAISLSALQLTPTLKAKN
jgi:hypothetical protein